MDNKLRGCCLVAILQMAEANTTTIPMETTEEALLRSDPGQAPAPEQGTINVSHTRRLSGRERDERHKRHVEQSRRRLRNRSSPRHRTPHQIQGGTHLFIVAHPVVRFDGVITIVRRQLKQEVSINVAPDVVRVSYYICYLSFADRCYRCGKIGHIKKNCTSATRNRGPRQTVRYVFSASTIHFHKG